MTMLLLLCIQNLSVSVQPHQLYIDELNALMKDTRLRAADRSAAAAQLDDVNQRWTVMLQHVVNTKVCLFVHC